MSGNKSTKSNRINVKNMVYSKVTSDDIGATTYGDVKALSAAMQVQLTPAVSSGVLYGDGIQQENISKLTGIAMALDVNKISIEDRAEILGNKYENGILIETGGDEAPYIAVGYLVEGTNGKNEYVWLLKGRAQTPNSTVQQSTENINFSTDSITINFIPRESDKQIRYFADSANADFVSAQAEKWFTTGPSKPVTAL